MISLQLIHLAATTGFCTLLWVVQLLVYPQMASVRAEDFKKYHHRHTFMISWIVVPLFLAEGLCAVASLWHGWQVDPWLQVASVGLFAANSLLTFLWFVPAHSRLALGRDGPLLRKLVRMNAWRTGMSTLRLLVVLWLVAGHR